MKKLSQNIYFLRIIASLFGWRLDRIREYNRCTIELELMEMFFFVQMRGWKEVRWEKIDREGRERMNVQMMAVIYH